MAAPGHAVYAPRTRSGDHSSGGALMRRFRTAALLAGGVVAAAVVVPGVAPVAGASPHETVSHGMLVKNTHAARPTRAGKNLTYHGGAVGKTVRVVIVYWGSQWGSQANP